MTTKDSGQSVCEKIQNERDRLNKDYQINKIWSDATGQISPIYGISKKSAQIEQQKNNDPNDQQNEAIQIIDRNISQEKKLEIENQCMQSTLSEQINNIDNRNCPTCNYGIIYDDEGKYIDKIPANELMKLTNNNPGGFCNIENIQQTNLSNLQNKCIINNIISELMKAQSDIQSHALARLMAQSQETWDYSGGGASFSCQDINQNLSQKDYLNIINTCAQGSSILQQNIITHCGKAINISQNNLSTTLNECIHDKVQKKQTVVDSNINATIKDNKNNINNDNKNNKNNKPSEGDFDLNILLYILIPVIIIFILLSFSVFFIMYSSKSK